MTYGTPAYLHLSPPVEDCVATLTWPRVPMADGYEVECLWDGDFASAHTGGKWADLHEGTYTWWDIPPGHSWEAVHRHPTGKGLLWDNLRFLDTTWGDVGEKDRDWAHYHGLPMSHLIYRGPGIPVSDVDEKLSWRSVHQRSISWQHVGGRDVDWYALQGRMGAPELSLPALVPVGKKTVCYRIRALFDEDCPSDWVETGVHDVTPLAHREDLAAVYGEESDGMLQQGGHLPPLEATVRTR